MSEQKDVALAAKEERARRVQNLKKAIIISLLLAILLPILLCIILFARVGHLEKELEKLKAERELQKVEEAAAQVEVALSGQDSDGNQEQEESVKVFAPEEANVLEKTKTTKVYLTFDDGPSGNTKAILDILARYHVQATFFVVGKEGEAYRSLYRRIVEEGHTIGMHSYSHKYNEIYASVDAYAEDLTKLQEYIYETTGTWSRICRFPGGSSNTVSKVDMEELIAYLKEQDIDYFDWNVSSLDATSRKLSVEEIAGNVLSDIEEYSTAVVLMHDADDKTTTVEALPIIIEALQSMENVEILPITDDTVRVQHVIKK
ncbi:MAG: polysaccharide deacetylase [Roseburia sp.]|nr:polysaccharide deacetylase [Roseburia sp.]MCM1277432.1 polysaccharide deacetylase [Robinsoniella sp.]